MILKKFFEWACSRTSPDQQAFIRARWDNDAMFLKMRVANTALERAVDVLKTIDAFEVEQGIVPLKAAPAKRELPKLMIAICQPDLAGTERSMLQLKIVLDMDGRYHIARMICERPDMQFGTIDSVDEYSPERAAKQIHAWLRDLRRDHRIAQDVPARVMSAMSRPPIGAPHLRVVS